MSQVLTLTDLGRAGPGLSHKGYDFSSTVHLRGLREEGQQVGEEAAAHKPSLGILSSEALVSGFQQNGSALRLIPNPVRAKFTSELLQGGQDRLNGTFNLVLLLLPSKVCR